MSDIDLDLIATYLFDMTGYLSTAGKTVARSIGSGCFSDSNTTPLLLVVRALLRCPGLILGQDVERAQPPISEISATVVSVMYDGRMAYLISFHIFYKIIGLVGAIGSSSFLPMFSRTFFAYLLSGSLCSAFL